jgi:hypothetical protein
VTTELNTWDAFNPGRLDQHLLSFYQKGIAQGALNRQSAEELLQCFWIKFNNQPAPRLLLRPEQSPAGRDHRAHGARGVLSGKWQVASDK